MPGIIASLALTKTLALICDIRKGRLSDVPANFTGMGRGSTQEPPRRLFEISIFWFVQLHQNLPQYFRRNHVADTILIFLNYFAEPCRRCIWGISSKPRRRFIFDDDLGHGNHSGELLLFVGCIVNFIVSYLICMFQDSVPAGSYNDPFLSSV